jgi:hypothetical protein
VTTYPDYLAVLAARAIEQATKEHPRLTRWGWSSPGDDDPHHPLHPPCVATAIAFILYGPVKIRSRAEPASRSSYGWKHSAEDWGAGVGMEPYVSNGDFIAAALSLGVPVGPTDGPNCKVGLKLLRDIDHPREMDLTRYRSAALGENAL